MSIKRLALTGLSACAFLAGACSNTVEGLKKDADENKVGEKTEKAAEAVASAVEEAGHEIKTKTLALQVKGTLMADKKVDASHVHVDADDDARILTLTGTVPTAAQKEAAGAIARGKAGDYRVRNLLTVAS
jgi:osmotically-inducible protein OsmY